MMTVTMSASTAKKPPASGTSVSSRSATPDLSSSSSPSRTPRSSTSTKSATGTGTGTGTASAHTRARSIRNGTPVSARAAAAALTRRDSHIGSSSTTAGSDASADAAAAAAEDARAEASAKIQDLQELLAAAEAGNSQLTKQSDVLQKKLDEAAKEAARLEERVHEGEETVEGLRLEKREAARQMREMEAIYEAERSSMNKEKEDMANREESMQTVIQRLKDSLAQRNNNNSSGNGIGNGNSNSSNNNNNTSSGSGSGSSSSSSNNNNNNNINNNNNNNNNNGNSLDDEGRSSRQANHSPSVEGGSFAPPSSLTRSDSRNNSKLLLQKDKLIESLRLELAEAQIKLVESENQGGGRLQEVERLLMEARMANARLMEDNESYQLLLQERTLNGDFSKHDFAAFSDRGSNQDALNALEGRSSSIADGGAGDSALGSSLADELSDAAEADVENYRRLEADLRASDNQIKALQLYIHNIIERLLSHQGFEDILDQSSSKEARFRPNINKDLPPPPQASGSSIFQRARFLATGGAGPAEASASPRPFSARPRPMSFMPAADNSAHTDPDRAPSIPIGNLTRSASTRRTRPMSEQFSLVSQMYRGPDGGTVSPTLGPQRGPQRAQTFFAPSTRAPSAGSLGTAAATANNGGGGGGHHSSGNFPGMPSETSSVSGDSTNGDGTDTISGTGISASPTPSSPPRGSTASAGGSSGHHEKSNSSTFVGNKPRPLRLVQENTDSVKAEGANNKRSSWIGWAFGGSGGPTSSKPEMGGEVIRE